MLLPTSVVGSHGLPGWVWLAREAMEAGRLGATDLRELMEDATQAALLDQERAGIDVVTTGEMMRVRFIIGFYDRITGIRRLAPPRKLGQPLWDTNTPFDVVEKIQAPDGLGIVEEWKLARSLTTTDKELGAGVIDVKAFRAETAAEVAERIRRLLEFVAPDKLWLNPDCGFWETPRWIVKQKLTALVEGARTVRKELGG